MQASKIIKNLLFNNIVLKVISFIIGATMWFIINQSHTMHLHKEIPLCFYGPQKDFTITAPESIHVTLCGTRNDLQSLDLDSLALHINSAILHEGPNSLSINRATLFLPEQINVLHYSPLNSMIMVKSKITEQNSSSTLESATTA